MDVFGTVDGDIVRLDNPLPLPTGCRVEVTIQPVDRAKTFPTSSMKLGELESFLKSLPDLGDDADAFAKDLQTLRKELPIESDPWE